MRAERDELKNIGRQYISAGDDTQLKCSGCELDEVQVECHVMESESHGEIFRLLLTYERADTARIIRFIYNRL
jgi:hypothetical protein